MKHKNRQRRLSCPAVKAYVPVPCLEWTIVADNSFRAEPLPGYVFEVVKIPNDFGWLFYLPGKPAQPASGEGVAKHSCEHWWLNAMGALLDPERPVCRYTAM